MFRWGVSYSDQEYYKEEGVVVDECVGVLGREEGEKISFCVEGDLSS